MADQREDYYNAHRDDRMFEVPQSRLEEMTDTIKRLTADLAAARADAARLAEIVQRYRIMGDWFRAAAAIHKDAAAALYEHQRGEG